MKVLRGILVFILSFVLTSLIIGVTLTTAVKEVVQNQLVSMMVKQLVVEEIDDDDKMQLDAINEIFNYTETNEIINSAIQDYVKFIDGDSEGISENTVDMIIDFCVEHKSDLEKISGEEINIEDIKSLETKEEIIDTINSSINEMKIDKSSPAVQVVSSYGKITSNSFRVTLLGIIMVLVLLIGTISWSLYKWMKPVGVSLMTSGVVVSIFYILIDLITSFANQSIGININIDCNMILIAGIIELVSGIVIVTLYAIINKIVGKRQKNEPEHMSTDYEKEQSQIFESESSQENQVVEEFKEKNQEEIAEETKNDNEDVEIL